MIPLLNLKSVVEPRVVVSVVEPLVMVETMADVEYGIDIVVEARVLLLVYE